MPPPERSRAKLIVLDRDGVINYDSDAYIKSPDEWRPLPGSPEATCLGDERLHLRELVFDLLALEAGEALQAHVEDGVRLDLRELEALDELGARIIGIFRLLDDLDDLVDVIECFGKAQEDVLAFLGAGEIVFRAARDDFLSVRDE